MVLLDSNLAPEEESLLNAKKVATLIDGCEIEAEIGRGASATVFRAHQAAFDRKVAIKVMSKRKQGWKLRFQVERRAMARLEHPNIVQPYAFHENDEFYCLIMKYVDGCSLQELIDQSGSYQTRILATKLLGDWRLFASMALDAADAIDHAHRNGIIHRDLKPSNLLIDQNFKVWVTDFGLTKLVDEDVSLSKTGDIVGTPRFMAPEQFQGGCDERSDVYSLGLTLCAVATGCSKAFDDDAHLNAASRASELRRLNPDIPNQLAEVISKACELNPIDRFQSATEMKVVLERFLAGGIAERRSRTRGRKMLYIRRLPQKLAAAALASLALVGIYFSFQGQSDVSQPASATPVNVVADHERMLFHEKSVVNDLIDDKPGQLDALLKRFAQRHVDDLATTMSLSLEEKNGLQKRLDALFDDRDYKESIAKTHESIRKTGYIQTIRLLRLNQVIEQSSISQQEKDNGMDLVRKLAYLTSEGIVSQDEASDLEKSLTYGRTLNAAELAKTSFSELRLREWLRGLEKRVNAEPEVEKFDVRMSGFLDALQGRNPDAE